MGSVERLRYVATSGNSIPGRSGKTANIVSEEGHMCLLTMQVTDDKKPVMRASQSCGAGHMATLRKDGGTILHLASGQEMRFCNLDNAYRLTATGNGEESDFGMQGW